MTVPFEEALAAAIGGGTGDNFSFMTGETEMGGFRPPKRGSMGRPAGPIPVKATPNSRIGGDFGDVTWAQLPDYLFATDREAWKDLTDKIKATGYTSWVDVLRGASVAQMPFEDFMSYAADMNDKFGEPGPGSGGPTSSTTTSTTLSSESSAAATIDNVFQQELGRMATPDEIRAFQKALNEQQAKSPMVSQYSNSGGSNQTISSTQSGGFDAARFATEWAQSRPEYAETQAATSFMDLLDRTIANPNAVSQLIGGGQ